MCWFAKAVDCIIEAHLPVDSQQKAKAYKADIDALCLQVAIVNVYNLSPEQMLESLGFSSAFITFCVGERAQPIKTMFQRLEDRICLYFLQAPYGDGAEKADELGELRVGMRAIVDEAIEAVMPLFKDDAMTGMLAHIKRPRPNVEALIFRYMEKLTEVLKDNPRGLEGTVGIITYLPMLLRSVTHPNLDMPSEENFAYVYMGLNVIYMKQQEDYSPIYNADFLCSENTAVAHCSLQRFVWYHLHGIYQCERKILQGMDYRLHSEERAAFSAIKKRLPLSEQYALF